jgi:hypothetical protein
MLSAFCSLLSSLFLLHARNGQFLKLHLGNKSLSHVVVVMMMMMIVLMLMLMLDIDTVPVSACSHLLFAQESGRFKLSGRGQSGQ